VVKRVLTLIACGLSLSTPAVGQETANAILACKVSRVDPNYVNPDNPSELRTVEPQLDIVIGFGAVGSTVTASSIRVSDTGRVLGGNRITEVTWNPQTRGFVIMTEDHGEGPFSLVIGGPEAGMMTQAATVIQLNEEARRRPLAYMFNGRCGLLPTNDLSRDFDHYVASLGSSQ
jgi:hypothetical protein